MSIARHVLLTGATGVLGRELIPRLLREHPGARVTLLLRSALDHPVAGQVMSSGSSLGMDESAGDLVRLDAVVGDVTLPRLGLPTAKWRELARSVTHVIHGAATTRLDEARAIARHVNLGGTLRALEFAASCRDLALFGHVSTAYVCGDRQGVVREADLWMGQRFLNAYEESKCLAEIHLRARANELPIAVFRPSIIVGDSRTGHISSLASLYSPLRRIAEGSLRRMPCRGDASLDLIPVDHVAEAIATLTARARAVGETYHLCAGPGRRVPMSRLLEETIRIAGSGDAPPLRFAPEDRRAAPEGTPPRLRVFFDYVHLDREFSIDRTVAHVGADVIVPRSDFLTPMLEFCRRTDWGRRPAAQEVAA